MICNVKVDSGRSNDRIQKFDSYGNFVQEIDGVSFPRAVILDGNGEEAWLYVVEEDCVKKFKAEWDQDYCP